MATMVSTYDTPRRSNLFPLAVLLLLAVIGATIYFASSAHAIERHGEIADLVEESCRRTGGLTQFLNPTTKRVAIVTCVVVDGEEKFGVGIYEKGKNVTAFLKDKMKTLDQVVQYLKNAGYVWK